MSLSASGHKGRRSDLAVPGTDTKSRRGLRIGTRFSAIRNYVGRAPELSFGLSWDAGGGSSSYSSRERACARDHYPPRWRCAGSRPPTTRSAVLPLSCVSIPSKKSFLSSITNGANAVNSGSKRIGRTRRIHDVAERDIYRDLLSESLDGDHENDA